METSGVCWQRTHGHPPEEILERYSMGLSAGKLLSEEECEQVEEHLLLCETCRNQLDESDEWVALIKAAAVPAEQGTLSVSPRPAWQSWFRVIHGFGSWPSLAGGMAMLVAMFWALPSASPPGVGGSVSAVSLSAVRGNDLRTSIPAGKALELNIEDKEVSGADIQIVDAAGHLVWSGTLQLNLARVPALKKGLFWVRLMSPGSGEQIKEYGLVVQ